MYYYSNLLDTVLTNPFEKMQTQAYLNYSLSKGQTPIFTLNQSIDNPSVISSLINQTGKTSKENINAIYNLFKNDFIRVSLYSDYKNIKNYIISVLDRGMDSKSGLFKFSSLEFLFKKYEKKEDITKIYNSMKSAFEQDNPKSIKNNSCCTTDDAEILESYIHVIMQLDCNTKDHLIQKREKIPNEFTLSELFSKRVNYINKMRDNWRVDNATVDMLLEVDKQVNTNTRSDYIDQIEKIFTDKNDRLYKFAYKLINLCYNEALMHSINGLKFYNITIDQDDVILNELYRNTNECEQTQEEQSLFIPNHDSIEMINKNIEPLFKNLTWSRTYNIVNSVKDIADNQKKPWNQALDEYYWQQTGQVKKKVFGAGIIISLIIDCLNNADLESFKELSDYIGPLLYQVFLSYKYRGTKEEKTNPLIKTINEIKSIQAVKYIKKQMSFDNKKNNSNQGI